MLGAVAHATERVELMTYVTCPTIRYHPAVVAQKAATLRLLSDGRFTLGLGAGENLNEHVVGEGWPAVTQRQDMLVEAIEIIRALHTGELVDLGGRATSASTRPRSGTCRTAACRIAVAVSGESSIERFAPLADHLIAVEPDGELVQRLGRRAGATRAARAARSVRSRSAGARTRSSRRARARAVPLVRRRLGRERRPADADGVRRRPASSSARRTSPSRSPAARTSTSSSSAVRPFWEAGFTDVALVQVGDESQERIPERGGRAAAGRNYGRPPRVTAIPHRRRIEMFNSLHGKRVAILAADGVEKVELEQPRAELTEKGAHVAVLSLKAGEIQARNHDLEPAGTIAVDRTVSDASVEDYDALVLPGGTVNPDKLRVDDSAVSFVRDFVMSGKPVAAICHGPWTLVEAGVVAGRTLRRIRASVPIYGMPARTSSTKKSLSTERDHQPVTR